MLRADPRTDTVDFKLIYRNAQGQVFVRNFTYIAMSEILTGGDERACDPVTVAAGNGEILDCR